MDPVGPVGSWYGGTDNSVGPIELGSSAAPCRISCELNSFSFDIRHLRKELIILNKCISEAIIPK
ncbi:hypothetical protein COM96_06730 [Bacillus cereus]|uniref:Uncharacterized protein n=1 Tax=Bacillus cereus TaxID=1396 RepID=A0A2A7I1N4_BACCE|nr:hypothetical protein COM96_06730 [Bacillus cereus]